VQPGVLVAAGGDDGLAASDLGLVEVHRGDDAVGGLGGVVPGDVEVHHDRVIFVVREPGDGGGDVGVGTVAPLGPDEDAGRDQDADDADDEELSADSAAFWSLAP
jgi:hypothetical protein